jgi:hypothetical protein
VYAQKNTIKAVYTGTKTSSRHTKEAFNKVHSDIEIKWVRDSAGAGDNKLLASQSQI